ncbi:MAG TPA: outer membrane lipoprotein chaperone LolA [Terriglobales bacterium]|nr:outer membrane lipoprotein chaperone LolA [Terriglobales bacterium]
MRILKPLLYLILVMFLLSLAMGADQQGLESLTSKVDDHYNHLRSMRSHFVEEYRGAGMSRTESGTLYLKKPGKMLWDYQQPRKKLFVSDGKTAWFYVPGEQQARKAPVSKLDDIRSPLRFLLGKTKLRKEFDQLGIVSNIKPENPGDIVLRGSPKGMEDRVAQVTLEITPEGRIDRIKIEEVDGAVTDFRFSDTAENVTVADKLFQFKPPPGVEVVEGPELGN